MNCFAFLKTSRWRLDIYVGSDRRANDGLENGSFFFLSSKVFECFVGLGVTYKWHAQLQIFSLWFGGLCVVEMGRRAVSDNEEMAC